MKKVGKLRIETIRLCNNQHTAIIIIIIIIIIVVRDKEQLLSTPNCVS